MKKLFFFIFTMFLFVIASASVFAQVPEQILTQEDVKAFFKCPGGNTDLLTGVLVDPETGYINYASEYLNGSFGITGDTALGVEGLGYFGRFSDSGPVSQIKPYIVLLRTLGTMYGRPLSITFSYWIPPGYSPTNGAVAMANSFYPDSNWNSTGINGLNPNANGFQQITIPLTVIGVSNVNQIIFAFHSPLTSGNNLQFLIYLDEIKINYANNVTILIDPGSGIRNVPSRPVISLPYNGYVYLTPSQCAGWNYVTGQTYQAQVATDANFTNIVFDQTTTTSSLCATLQNAYYYFRMRAKFSQYTWYSGWTSGIGFGVQYIVGMHQVSSEVPEKFALKQNYPNPFNPTTKIKFDVPVNGNVRIAVYDILGREVANIQNGDMQPGTYEVDFDGSNLSSGTYFYSLMGNGFADTKKMVLMK